MSSASTSQPIAGIHIFDLPSVWLGDIALWLRTVESRFDLRQITREDTKFHYVVAALPMDIATDLRDIIDCPPTEAPYTALKEALISRISLSTQKRLQRLISEEDLGDRKPTQLLRRLEQFADGQNWMPPCSSNFSSNGCLLLCKPSLRLTFLHRLFRCSRRLLTVYSSTISLLLRLTSLVEAQLPPQSRMSSNAWMPLLSKFPSSGPLVSITLVVLQFLSARDLPLQTNLQLMVSVGIITIMVLTPIAATLRASIKHPRRKTPLPTSKGDERGRHILSQLLTPHL
nr:unnamed protein product [Spirometra erinaceieuropaei]